VEMTIRRALPEDAYDWAVCRISCWQSAYKGIFSEEIINNMPSEKEQHIERYKKCLTDQGNIEYYSVVLSEKMMIGSLVIDRINSEIWAIYLLEQFWGKGYGKKIMDFAVNELKCEKTKEIYLWVFEKNHRARRFYEKYGFRADGAQKESGRYGIPLVELRYVLQYT